MFQAVQCPAHYICFVVAPARGIRLKTRRPWPSLAIVYSFSNSDGHGGRIHNRFSSINC